MQLKNGDRVKHPTLQTWGLGQVIGPPVRNTVKVFFVGVGEKTIALDHASLIPVSGSEASSPLLDNLRRREAGAIVRYRSLPDLMTYFLRTYPGGFYGEKFLTEEREYKVAAHHMCRNLLSEAELRDLVSSGDADEIVQRALRVVNATNLISPNDKVALRAGLSRSESRKRFAAALCYLLLGSQTLERRFVCFSEALETIGAAKWAIASYFPFLYQPRDSIFLKPTVTERAAEVCAFEINYRSDLNWRTYERVQAFARYMTGAISELKPRDMIDVQSFIWCAVVD